MPWKQQDSTPFAGIRSDIENNDFLKTMRTHLVAAAAEFVGTTLFLFFAFSAVEVSAASNASQGLSSGGLAPDGVNFIAISFGFSLLANVWVFYRVSGGLFNPVVSLALSLVGAVPWVRFAVLFPAQMLGGIVAAALAKCMLPGDSTTFQTRLTNGTTAAQGVFIEMFLTALLIISILMLAAEKHSATYVAPVGIGLTLYVCELAGVYWTGGSLNPARSFGPDVANTSFPTYHYIYWFGPLMGSLIAVGFYYFLKLMNYQEVNPGQDAQDSEEEERQKERLSPATSRPTSRPIDQSNDAGPPRL